MGGLIPLAEEIQQQRRQIHQRKGRQETRQPQAQRPGADAEQDAEERSECQILAPMCAELRDGLRKVAPLLRCHRNPFDAAAAGEQPDGDDDQTQSDPDGPRSRPCGSVRSRARRQRGIGPVDGVRELCHVGGLRWRLGRRR